MYKSASSSDEHVESEWEQAGCWSQFTFSVPNRMLRTGSTQELTFDDMTSQPKSDHVAKLLIPLRKQWAQSKAVWFIPRLMVSLLRSMPYHITILFSGTVIETTLQILKPVMLMAFLNKLADPTASTDDKYLYASGIAGLGVAYVVVHHILFFFSMRTGWSWRMVTQAMVFEHLLSLDSSSLQYSSKGNMVNLISNDVEKFERFCVFMMFVITGPFEIIALLIKMGGEFAKWRTKTARNTDKRIRHIGESIEGISSLKSYGWETPFFALIKKLRSHEQDTISRSQALKALDLSKLFACLLFLQVLRSSVFIHWTAGIEMGSESIASCHRLEAFLSLTPADKRAIDGIQLLEKNELVLRIPGKNFCYSSLEGTKAVLSNINVELKKNELLIVVGPVGSGKSSFLGAVLGDTPTASTSFFIGEHPRIAFCPQIPWIFSASVQENIIGMYDLALSSCCIEEDLKQLPDRDATEIGEKGVSISGGQKARLALARAVYSDADIYLLDDPLSAVDAHVSRALLDDCIIGALKQRGKTVVLCTHQMQYLKYADKVLVLGEDGNQNNNLLLNQLEIEGRDRSKSVSTSSKDDSVKELKAIGNISLSVYTQWLRAGGLLRGVFVFFLITASQAMLMVHEYWLRRILNRFSKDQSQADELLPSTLFDCYNCTMICAGAIVLVCVAMPIILYMASMREIKRIEAITRSPIYAGFSATLEGLTSIRAYKLQQKMSTIFCDFLDENGRAWWSYLMASRWFGFRMDSTAIIFLMLTSYGSVYYSDVVDLGLLGFALVYSMNLAGLMQWSVRLSAEVESMMTGIERIAEYSLLPEEPDITSSTGNLQDGSVVIHNMVARYRTDLEPVLNGLTLNVQSGSKCGIVGRTGSGKSTILDILKMSLEEAPIWKALTDANIADKIILMDEVTASVDYETDTAIQRTIRTAPALKDATIITVAHRLQTIADADSLFVISGGAVVEQGSPLELLDKKGSFFEALVRKSGESKLIRDIATAAARKGSNVKA
eukprot:GSChrysophyteH1.ASY1.ANO1.3345.1 assembled CDS